MLLKVIYIGRLSNKMVDFETYTVSNVPRTGETVNLHGYLHKVQEVRHILDSNKVEIYVQHIDKTK
jgi:hypothetical protein